MTSALSVSFTLSLWLSLCCAQSPWIGSNEFLRMFWHSSIVVGEYAYIVGGEMWKDFGWSIYYGRVSPKPLNLTRQDIYAFESYTKLLTLLHQVNQTIAVPLSKSWTNSTVQIQATDFPSSFPHLKSPTLWLDQSSNLIWFFNGETSFITTANADPLSIWAFSPDKSGSGTWKETNSPNDNVFNSLTRSYGCGSTYSPTAGYCLGGYSSQHTSPNYDGSGSTLALGGMQVFDFADRSWSNVSSAGASANGWNVWPVFQYVPTYGRSGVIVVIGGDTPTVQSDGNDISGQEPSRPMSNVTIYDIYNQRWLSQTATGDVPTGRLEPCFAGAQGGDNSTYEIFVFGGWVDGPGASNTDSHQVYVLSLPAFRWFRATESTAPRIGHTCNMIGNRQMLTLGGYDPTAADSNTPDPFLYGIGIFDMTEWTWKSGYVADAKPYEPASQVSQYYSTNSKYPSWDNPTVQALIEANATSITTSTTSSSTSTPASSSSGSSTPSQGSSSTPTGAIVGGVVGGIAFLALVGAAIWFFMRQRRRRDRGDLAPQNYVAEMSTNPNPVELGMDPAELGPARPHELGPGMAGK